ncbi:MAG: HypC/HybG/HupF family hydrogenase formation chaperone [Candidatus Aenigmatarchaeota archaeon]
MCITTFGKILCVDGNIALVQLKKSKREVRIDLLDAKEGDYVYISGNLGIEKISKNEAEKIWRNGKYGD